MLERDLLLLRRPGLREMRRRLKYAFLKNEAATQTTTLEAARHELLPTMTDYDLIFARWSGKYELVTFCRMTKVLCFRLLQSEMFT